VVRPIASNRTCPVAFWRLGELVVDRTLRRGESDYTEQCIWSSRVLCAGELAVGGNGLIQTASTRGSRRATGRWPSEGVTTSLARGAINRNDSRPWAGC
jgi:hypothetical protein